MYNKNIKMATGYIKTIMLGSILGMGALTSGATDGVEISHLSHDNTMVRITGDAPLLLLPVQESVDDAKINVIVDGQVAETIYVRLAKNKTDYNVPFDLTPYKGKNVVLDIITPQGRGSIREAVEDACWNGIELADTFDTTDRETKYRPLYHHTPAYGWMNDPNGMFYKDGVWHLYYQYNPYGSKWQNMTWAHSTSKDLIHWEHQPLAIKPNGLGAVFSGSSVLDSQNTAGFGEDAVIALYTSAGKSQTQSLAWSKDNGQTFEIYPGNPILTYEGETRDPNMFWNKETGEWNLVLAHALDHEMLIFSSPDLKTWTLQSTFGKVGQQDGVWECPDLFQLPVAGTDDKKWVMICNLNPGGPFGGSGIQYFVGDFDGKTFTAETDAAGEIPVKWLDFGKDNYAVVSFSDAPDNRRTIVGWMSNWQYAADVPTTQYRSANTLPTEIGLFKGDDGMTYASTVPSPELLALRGKPLKKPSTFTANASGKTFALPATNDGICEITLDIVDNNDNEISLILNNKQGNEVKMVYNPKEATFTFDRTKSGLTDFSDNFPAVTTAPTFDNKGNLSLRIFIDRSSIEIFGNERFTMTNLVFPDSPYTGLKVVTNKGNAKIENLTIYPINIK